MSPDLLEALRALVRDVVREELARSQPVDDRLLTATEAAALLAVPVSTVRQLGREGRLPTVTGLGRTVRYRASDVKRLISR